MIYINLMDILGFVVLIIYVALIIIGGKGGKRNGWLFDSWRIR
jgi:hypothetical protein